MDIAHEVQRFLTVTVLSVMLLVTSALSASATTGPTQFLGFPHYHVAANIARLYRGQYRIDHPVSSHLVGASLGIEINPYGFLQGISQFYGYDAHGFQTSWIATVYNFHLVARGVMEADILGQASKILLGRFYLTRSRSGNLAGRLVLGKTSYRIVWRKVNGG